MTSSIYDQLTDVTLLDLYLSAWTEKYRNQPGNEKVRYCCWKTHLPEILDELERQRCIEQPRNCTSVTLTDVGIARAEKLFKIISPILESLSINKN